MAVPNDTRVLEAVLAVLPDTHLAIWTKVKQKLPEVHPAEVWRCLANTEALKHDRISGMWSRKVDA